MNYVRASCASDAETFNLVPWTRGWSFRLARKIDFSDGGSSRTPWILVVPWFENELWKLIQCILDSSGSYSIS